MIIVLYPFVDATRHITQTLAGMTGRELAHWTGERKAVIHIGSIAVRGLLTPRVRHLLTTISRGIFPFCFRWQTGTYPCCKRLGIFPAYSIDGMIFGVGIEKITAGRLGAYAGIDTLSILRHGHGMPHHLKVGDRDRVSRRCGSIA